MKITFPHMGTLAIAFLGALRNLNVDVVIPKRAAKNSELLGIKYSPEFVCLPFKLNLSNFIEALDKGADTLVMIGGTGPCRLGYYSVVQEQILRRMGYEFRFIRADDPDQMKTILHTMKEVSGVSSTLRLLKEYFFIMKRLDALDEVARIAHQTRPFEIQRGETSRLLRKSEGMIDHTRNFSELRQAMKKIKALFQNLPSDKSRPIVRVAILGEIFIVLETVANTGIEEKLGEMGAAVERGVTISAWFNERVHYAPWRRNQTKKAARLARPYLKANAGGESLLSVGKTIEYAQRGFDGVVHLLPFSCMPELIAQAIMDRISRDFQIPILHLTFDEHVTEMGYNTRLEAFLDMLHRKKSSSRSGI
ncbi:2-hydroxyacyl-CoA dehydratase [candidate division CSSED10-310 bacterium]|uniref:2-hydroxyacyl-CoA dehydratase n=1 Tax=candidate division CSSED10-310 bacterium TaxID=2855610 RepID=A0ABV6YR35_UNCC1